MTSNFYGQKAAVLVLFDNGQILSASGAVTVTFQPPESYGVRGGVEITVVEGPPPTLTVRQHMAVEALKGDEASARALADLILNEIAGGAT